MVQAHTTLDPNFLTGKWEGTGSVFVQSSGKTIHFKETSEFKLLKQEPCWLINYQQFTKNAENGNPMHAENGFWKIFKPDGENIRKIEASFSHPFSINEFEVGQVGKHAETGHTFITMAASETDQSFQRGPSAAKLSDTHVKHTTAVRREFWFDDEGALHYKMYLGVNGAEPYHHLTCKLTKMQ